MNGFVARLSIWALSSGGGGVDPRSPVPVRPVDAARLLGVTPNTARNHWDRWQDLWLDTGEGWIPNTAAWPDDRGWWHPVSPASALRISRLSWPCAQISIYLLGKLRRRRFAQEPTICVTVRELAVRLNRSPATIAAALRSLEREAVIARIAPGAGRETRISTGSWLGAMCDANTDTVNANPSTDGAISSTKNANTDTQKRKSQYAPPIRGLSSDKEYKKGAHRGMGLDVGEAILRDPLLTADQLLENAETFAFTQPTPREDTTHER
jgi:hypothetical protein